MLCIELEEVWRRAEVWDEGLEMVRGEHDGGRVVVQSSLLARADNREDE